MKTSRGAAIALVGALAFAALGRADAPPGRYTIANGTVYDTKTRLTWQQSLDTATHTWADAAQYCGALPLGGAGWRVPTAKELPTIIDDARYGPGVDPAAFPGTPTANFWTSSASRDVVGAAWFVSFDQGEALTSSTSSALRVRCVR